MCGICGFVDYRNSYPLKEDVIRLMCSKLKHRGPDDEGIYINKGLPRIAFGHRRLSIIDLSSAGHQPMSNENETVWLVLNGEIYNFQELKKNLKIKGHIFKSDTDTETIIHLYEEEGENCVKSLRGMFAFALWDVREEKLFLARDRVGKKPLIYSRSSGVFCFSSEFESLLESGVIKNEINLKSLDYYLGFGYIPAPFTVYNGVFKLPAAHTLTFCKNGIVLKQYWHLDYTPKLEITERDAQDELLRLLREAVKIRLRSDVPLGAFLSGGIDSSTVVALMSKLSNSRVKTFSIGFEDNDYTELKYARNIAKIYDTEHHEFIVKPKTLEILPLLIERYGEPYADSSCVPTYYVSKETRKFVTVALNGDGGDESFAGYERYHAMIIAARLENMPSQVKYLLRGFSGIFPDSIEPKSKLRRLRRFLEGAFLPGYARYAKWVSIFDDTFKKRLYTEDFINRFSSGDSLESIKRFFDNHNSDNILDTLLNVDVHTYLPYDLLVKVDIASMSNSLEARSPFLDHKLMEFAARLPCKYKLKTGIKKYILKKTIKDLVPAENVHRRKMGFGLPIGRWFRQDLMQFLKDVLLSDRSLTRGYFKPEVVRRMVDDHTQARKDYTFQLWSLLMLELWHQRFMD